MEMPRRIINEQGTDSNGKTGDEPHPLKTKRTSHRGEDRAKNKGRALENHQGAADFMMFVPSV
jgi:hypothetical protein